NQNVKVLFDNGYSLTTYWSLIKSNKVKSPYDKSIYGIGYIGEGDYTPTSNRKKTLAYEYWHNMMTRCYREEFHEKNPTYASVTVSKEWHNFQNFAEWFDNNYYEVKNEEVQLDKDLLVKGNREYSPEKCVFVPRTINRLLNNSFSARGELPVGVAFRKDRSTNPYQCYLTAYGKRNHLGFDETPSEAFKVYKEHKE